MEEIIRAVEEILKDKKAKIKTIIIIYLKFFHLLAGQLALKVPKEILMLVVEEAYEKSKKVETFIDAKGNDIDNMSDQQLAEKILKFWLENDMKSFDFLKH